MLDKEKISEQDLPIFQEKLSVILKNCNSIRQTIRAITLNRDNEEIFKEAKIISDIRLIFQNDIKEKNRDALIIHRLRKLITYRIDDEIQHQNVHFFTLDSADLIKLKEQIERALEKEKQIISSYENIISFIELKE